MNDNLETILVSTIEEVNSIFPREKNDSEQFKLWLEYGQFNPNFETGLKIGGIPIEKQHFFLETIFATAMKLTLLESRDLKGESLRKVFSDSERMLSEIIFEEDFYSWILDYSVQINDKIIKISNILKNLNPSTFDRIYEYFFKKRGRKAKGQFYTSADLALFITTTSKLTINNDEQYLFLDPACGGGAFIVSLLDLYQNYDNVEIIGIDNNYFSCVMSRIAYFKKYMEIHGKKIDFIPILWMDFLTDIGPYANLYSYGVKRKKIIGPLSKLNNRGIDYLKKIEENGLDLIIGNPPYIRIQNINKNLRGLYSRKFFSSIGRYDVFVLFIEQAIRNLKKKGKLAYICSNKFMTTSYGKGIREYLINNVAIQKIFDFTDTEMFGAMILPCVIVCQKGEKKDELEYTAITKTNKKPELVVNKDEFWNFLKIWKENTRKNIIIENHGNETVSIHKYICDQPSDSKPWHFLPKDIEKICKEISKNSDYLLGEIADIRVGLKTTCDRVFVFDKRSVPFQKKTSREFIHPLLRGKDIRKWRVPDSVDKFILYPYKTLGNKIHPITLEKYPEIKNYFYKNKKLLEARTYIKENPGREWFEIWVPHKPEIFESEIKIVTPDISPENRFAIDLNKYYCQGTCYIININQEILQGNTDLNYFILGLLNSELLEFYHKAKLSTTIYAKRHRYWYSHLSQYPVVIPGINSNLRNEIVKSVKKIIFEKVDTIEYEKIINEKVFELYGLSPEDINKISTFLEN